MFDERLNKWSQALVTCVEIKIIFQKFTHSYIQLKNVSGILYH